MLGAGAFSTVKNAAGSLALKDPRTVLLALVVGVALAGASSAGVAHADEEAYPPPLRQQDEGVPLYGIQCNDPRELYIRDSQTPLCLYELTYASLSERGMDLMPNPALAELLYSLSDSSDPVVVKQVVEESILLYKEKGREGAFDIMNQLYVTHQYYPFVLDADSSVFVSHSTLPRAVGYTSQVILGPFGTVPPEIVIEELMVSDGVWYEYVLVDSATGVDALKRSWLSLHDGNVFGAGYTFPIEKEIVSTVNGAIALYGDEGAGAFDIINEGHDSYHDPNDPFSVQSDQYPVVIDPYADPAGGLVVAHDKSTVSTMIPIEVEIGYANLADSMAENGQMVWMFAVNENDETGIVEQERFLGIMHDSYMFGAGYHYPVEEKVMALVDNTIGVYPFYEERLFESINEPTEIVDPHFLFVIDVETGEIIANGAFPDRVGSTSPIFDGADRPFEEILSDLQRDGGTWVEYRDEMHEGSFWAHYAELIHQGDSQEKKRSYLQAHEGYIFGSGYYLSPFLSFLPLP